MSSRNHLALGSGIPPSPTNLPPGIHRVDLPDKQSDRVVIDSNVNYIVHPTSQCTIHATGNRSWNSDDLWYFRLNYKILEIRTQLCGLEYIIFRKIYRCGIFTIQVLQGEAFDSAVVKKNLAQFRVRMAKISRFHCRHKISIGSPRCRGPQGTLMEGLGAVIDSDVIYTFHPISLCTIQATGNRSWKSDDLWHFCPNCKILEIRMQLCGIWYIIFRDIYRCGIFPIQVLQGEAFDSVAVKKN